MTVRHGVWSDDHAAQEVFAGSGSFQHSLIGYSLTEYGQVLVQVKKDLPFAGFALGLDMAPGICTGNQNEMPAMGAAQFPIEGAGWARNVLVQTIASN